MNRQAILVAVQTQYEPVFWKLMNELEKALKQLIKVPYVNMDDPSTIGAVLHGALPEAISGAGVASDGLDRHTSKFGPANKITGTLRLETDSIPFSVELHCSGPQGGTNKATHQFAEHDVDAEPEFPGFEDTAPQSLLFFLAYHLTPTKTAINKLYLMFADGVDRRKIELVRPKDISATVVEPVPEPSSGLIGTTLKVKSQAENKDKGNARQDKRGDAGSSS